MWNHSLLPRRWFGRLTLLAIVLTTAIGAILFKTVDVQGLDGLQADVRTAAPVLAIVRLLLIAGLFLAWPVLLRLCVRWDWIGRDTQRQLLVRRTRLAIWLVALELILGFDILDHFHSLLVWLMA